MKNRRELLMASAALATGAGAAGLASCGGGDDGGGRAETVSTVQKRDDAAILTVLLDLEESSIVAYGAIGADFAARFVDHERRHAAALRRMILELGGEPPPPKRAAEYRAAFPDLRGERRALEFALDVETTSIGAYGDALGKIAVDSVQIMLARILATESEHAAVVLGRLGRPRVPDAFVTGTPPVESE
jgi:Ferritin-like domain